MYIWNDAAAYHLSELIEDHAYETYSNFVQHHEEFLKAQPVPDIARKYYEHDNPYFFDLYCTVKDKDVQDKEEEDDESSSAHCTQPKHKKLETLYDVFCCIRDDEKEHWKTLCNLVQYNEMNAVAAQEVQSTQPS
jgi:ubiquinol oxidase